MRKRHHGHAHAVEEPRPERLAAHAGDDGREHAEGGDRAEQLRDPPGPERPEGAHDFVGAFFSSSPASRVPSSMPFLNSCIDLPSPRASSGSFLPPNSTSAITRMTISSCVPSPNMVLLLCVSK